MITTHEFGGWEYIQQKHVRTPTAHKTNLSERRSFAQTNLPLFGCLAGKVQTQNFPVLHRLNLNLKSLNIQPARKLCGNCTFVDGKTDQKSKRNYLDKEKLVFRILSV